MAKSTHAVKGFMSGWADGEDSWGVDMNTNLDLMMMLLQTGVIDRAATFTGAPGAGLGAVYIMTGNGGDWSGGATNDLAYWWKDYNDSAAEWKFITPWEGVTVWVNDEDRAYTFDGTNWVEKGTWTLQLSSASNTALGASHSVNNYLAITPVPRDATLLAAKVACSSVSVTTGVTADIYLEDGSPATIFSGAVTIGDTDDLTTKSATLSDTDFSADDILSLRVATGSGDDITNVSFTLYFIDA